MNDVHDVSHCGECPFRNADSIGSDVCGIDSERRDIEYGEAPPEWCPLLVAPSLVRIRAKVLP